MTDEKPDAYKLLLERFERNSCDTKQMLEDMLERHDDRMLEWPPEAEAGRQLARMYPDAAEGAGLFETERSHMRQMHHQFLRLLSDVREIVRDEKAARAASATSKIIDHIKKGHWNHVVDVIADAEFDNDISSDTAVALLQVNRAMNQIIDCPYCDGKGGWRGIDQHGLQVDADCHLCMSTGQITIPEYREGADHDME